jgi:hypothetical protein
MAEMISSLNDEQALAVLEALPALLAGQVADTTGAVHGLQLAMGVQALSLVKDAFVVKARGGTDAAGIQWKPLDPRYIAYGRRHPGLTHKKKGERPRGLLTQKQDDRWRAVFAGSYCHMAAQGMSDVRARGNAAAQAWTVVKAEGAKTILETFGKTAVEIGRDTDRMFNSLSPGLSGPSGDPDQVFRFEPGAVIVGTNVKYAGPFHAKRPLWPEPDKWPQAWLDMLSDILFDGLAILLRRIAA